MRTIPIVMLLSSSVAFAAGSLDESGQPFVDRDAPDDAEPVVGGTQAKPGEWPDVVAVIAPDALCSGTLIAPDLVLTAGHCIDVKPKEVLIGSVDYSKPVGEVIAVKSATAYPDWQHAYDVGLLELATASKVTPRAIGEDCTAAADLKTNQHVRVVGFGMTTASGTGDNTLLEQALLSVDDPTCATNPACRPSPINPGGEFVAGGHGVDACFGDSGGPLYASTSHGDVLIGVVSRGLGTSGEPCGQGGVNVRADKVASWIEKTSKRKLARAKCDGSGGGSSQDDPDASDANASGCSATTGALGFGLLVLAAAMWILSSPRRRESRIRR